MQASHFAPIVNEQYVPMQQLSPPSEQEPLVLQLVTHFRFSAHAPQHVFASVHALSFGFFGGGQLPPASVAASSVRPPESCGGAEPEELDEPEEPPSAVTWPFWVLALPPLSGSGVPSPIPAIAAQPTPAPAHPSTSAARETTVRASHAIHPE